MKCLNKRSYYHTVGNYSKFLHFATWTMQVNCRHKLKILNKWSKVKLHDGKHSILHLWYKRHKIADLLITLPSSSSNAINIIIDATLIRTAIITFSIIINTIKHSHNNIDIVFTYLHDANTQCEINVTHTHTHTRLTALCSGLPGWAGTRKAKPIWILLKQETVSGSGISWAICKSAPRSRQITTQAPHRSVFYRPDALQNQCQYAANYY